MHKTRSGDLRLKSGKSLGRIFFLYFSLHLHQLTCCWRRGQKRESESVCVRAGDFSLARQRVGSSSRRRGRESLQGIKWNNWCARPTRAACSVGGPHGAQKGPCFWSPGPSRPQSFPTNHFQCKKSAYWGFKRKKRPQVDFFGAFARAGRHKEEQIVNREEHFSLTHLSLYFLGRRFHRFSFTSGIRDEIKTGAPRRFVGKGVRWSPIVRNDLWRIIPPLVVFLKSHVFTSYNLTFNSWRLYENLQSSKRLLVIKMKTEFLRFE